MDSAGSSVVFIDTSLPSYDSAGLLRVNSGRRVPQMAEGAGLR